MVVFRPHKTFVITKRWGLRPGPFVTVEKYRSSVVLRLNRSTMFLDLGNESLPVPSSFIDEVSE